MIIDPRAFIFCLGVITAMHYCYQTWISWQLEAALADFQSEQRAILAIYDDLLSRLP